MTKKNTKLTLGERIAFMDTAKRVSKRVVTEKDRKDAGFMSGYLQNKVEKATYNNENKRKKKKKADRTKQGINKYSPTAKPN